MKSKKRKSGSRPAKSVRKHPARLLVCDDHSLTRKCVREILEEVPSIHVVGEAAGGQPAVRMALKLKPDLILMDVSMPDLDGIEATLQILARLPDTKVLAFSADSDAETMSKMFAAGAWGYVFKTGDPMDLVAALEKVLAGERFLSAPETSLLPD